MNLLRRKLLPLTLLASKEPAQNGVRREAVPGSAGGARRTLCASEELAQNGVRRETVPDSAGGARRTLCASEEPAQNGVRRETVFGPSGGARRTLCALVLLALAAIAQRPAASGQYPSTVLAGLQWRDVGPMRAGRSFGVAGHADQPDTFYMGSVGGGVWKTENSGRTWFPISDEGIPIGSIGAIAVAPSNANVVYVGTGESDIRSQNSYGIGMFKSTDAGKTWKHIGLDNTRQIGRVVVDPTNANRVYVAALGHIYAPNPDRGVYRSADGGANWKKVLFDPARPNDVGAVDLAIDPRNPRTIYASLWGTRRPPWSVYAPANLPGGGLFKSTDGGDTWKKLSGGLPADDFVGRIGIAIAPSNPRILWAVVDDLGSASPPPRPGRGAA